MEVKVRSSPASAEMRRVWTTTGALLETSRHAEVEGALVEIGSNPIKMPDGVVGGFMGPPVAGASEER